MNVERRTNFTFTANSNGQIICNQCSGNDFIQIEFDI